MDNGGESAFFVVFTVFGVQGDTFSRQTVISFPPFYKRFVQSSLAVQVRFYMSGAAAEKHR